LSKGYAFAYYEDESVTDAAIAGLNGLQIGDRTIAMRRHESCAAFKQDNMDNIVKNEKKATESNTLCMMQMVSTDELRDPEEIQDIKNDIATECSNYGQVLDIVIPGLTKNGQPLPGSGKVFVMFKENSEATKCKSALQGRNFAERTVVVSYYDTEKFRARDFI
jgi:splicing factor U2AF subunit